MHCIGFFILPALIFIFPFVENRLFSHTYNLIIFLLLLFFLVNPYILFHPDRLPSYLSLEKKQVSKIQQEK